jgi:uncharacterized DUF497 family protein
LWRPVSVVTITNGDHLRSGEACGDTGGPGLDFLDAEHVFDGITVEVEDTRRDYGETRIICYGKLAGRLVVVGYTPRGDVRHVFSMRKANAREEKRLARYFEVEPRQE